MFTHWLIGVLIFLVGGNILGLEINRTFLLLGAAMGALPDLLSVRLRLNKWTHEHRNDFFHSLFFPVAVFLITWYFSSFELAALCGLAVLTHPLLDLYGIGWGVKLLYPFGKRSFKLLHGNKFLYVFKVGEVREQVSKSDADDWFKKIFFTLNPISVVEWGSLILCLILIFLA